MCRNSKLSLLVVVAWCMLSRFLIGDWRDGSVVKSTCCSFRKPRFNSQPPCGDSELYVNSSSQNTTPF